MEDNEWASVELAVSAAPGAGAVAVVRAAALGRGLRASLKLGWARFCGPLVAHFRAAELSEDDSAAVGAGGGGAGALRAPVSFNNEAAALRGARVAVAGAIAALPTSLEADVEVRDAAVACI